MKTRGMTKQLQPSGFHTDIFVYSGRTGASIQDFSPGRMCARQKKVSLAAHVGKDWACVHNGITQETAQGEFLWSRSRLP